MNKDRIEFMTQGMRMRRGAVSGAVGGLAMAGALFFSPGAHAQLAPDFFQILNQTVDDCFQAESSDVDCGSYAISPNTDLQMRLAAPEELAVQKSLAKEFSDLQRKAVAGRLGALRAGALGGGAASDDAVGRLSTFGTYSHGFGSKDQSDYENEADYKGHDLLLGLDYRLNESFVAGAALGYMDKDVKQSAIYTDDDTEATSNADARNQTKGFGLTVYGHLEIGGAYMGASIGNQWLSQDTRRRADFLASSDPADAVPLTARGSTDSSNLQLGWNAGYVWRPGATNIDLGTSWLYQRYETDAFEESGAVCLVDDGTGINPCSGTASDLDLNMSYAKQAVSSMEGSLSLRVSRAMSARGLVLVPFAEAEITRQFEDDRYQIRAMYTRLYGDLNGDGEIDIDYFALNTEETDTSYGALSAGINIVGRRGWQGFLLYRRTLGMKNISDNTISAGVRLEL